MSARYEESEKRERWGIGSGREGRCQGMRLLEFGRELGRRDRSGTHHVMHAD